jgi:hypothetical protein
MPASDNLRPPRSRRAGLVAAGLCAVLALGAWCYAPALQASFAQDDFAFLAMVRLLGQPWLVFVHEHFPGNFYFRPLGLMLWWLVCAAAGAAAWPQYALNLLLHLGGVAALYTLLQRLRADAPANLVWAAIYAAHPLVVGTALWLSDRFDLLTTLFSLLAVNAALAYATRPRVRILGALLAALLLAFLSKELGIVGAAASCAAIAFAPRAALGLRQRAGALIAIAALTLAWLAYRQALFTPIAGVSATLPSLATFALGSGYWLRTGLTFLLGDPRASPWSAILSGVAAALWLGLALAARRKRRGLTPLRWNVVLALATLILLPGLVQAPVAAQHLRDFGADTFWFHLIVSSRFFYLACAGLVCALMLALPPAPSSSMARRLGAFAGLIALVAIVPTTRSIARTYAEGTAAPQAALQAAQAAIDRIDLPAQACQIYLLQTSSIWGFSGYSDATIKGMAASPQRLAHCLISTERPPWIYFVRSDSVAPADYAPLRPLRVAGKPLQPLRLGDMQALYLTMGQDMRAAMPAQAIFLEYRDGVFVDVSAAVRSGARTIDFVTTAQD